MGVTKQLYEEALESRREDWIRERLTSPDLEDDSEEWQQLHEEYDAYQDYLIDAAETEYKELEWLRANPHDKIYNSSISLLDDVLAAGTFNHSEPFIKMQIAYSVTILESCLSEMIRSVVLSDTLYRNNAIEHIAELQDIKVTLLQITKNPKIVDEKLHEILSIHLYHKIPKTMEMYKAVLQHTSPNRPNMTDVIKLTTLRHDIVHRNGYTIDGEKITFLASQISTSISTVKNFLTEINNMISDAIKHHNSKPLAKNLSL